MNEELPTDSGVTWAWIKSCISPVFLGRYFLGFWLSLAGLGLTRAPLYLYGVSKSCYTFDGTSVTERNRRLPYGIRTTNRLDGT